MSTPSCPTCDLLGENVAAATTRHVRLSGRLSIAKLADSAERVSELEILVAGAEVDRQRAVVEYCEHKDGHAVAQSRSEDP